MFKTFFCVGVIASFITCAHIFLKKHLLSTPLPEKMAAGDVLAWFKASMVTPKFLAVPICFGASCLLWIWLMNRTDMTVAYAMASIVYVFMFAAGHLFLGETMTWLKALGVVFIITGILCVTR